MKKLIRAYALLLSTIFVLSACGSGSSDSKGGGNNGEGNQSEPANGLNWSAIPSEFNPTTEDIRFQTDGFNQINLNAFGFTSDVQIVYSQDVQANTGFLRIFKVWKKSASWGDLKPRPNGTSLDLKSYGSYECSIEVSNGQISALEGGCYVKLQLFLPVGAEIEVYNVEKLISKKFFPIDTNTFLDLLDDAVWSEDKFVVIENFLASYEGTSKKPALKAEELGNVIADFLRSEEKLKALRRLHSIVIDRENLKKMIQNEFSYFDQDDALAIVGL